MKQKRTINLHYGDMTDSSSLIRIIQSVQPDEIYNLAAQSHVKVSFDVPEYTAETDAVGTLRMLEAVRILGMEKKTRIYQASHFRASSEKCRKCRKAKRPRSIPAALWRSQTVWLLDYKELPRKLWHVCCKRHTLQPRERTPR
mgnify:CR=1 FL=1